MVAITHKLRKRFVKDFKLPITVLQDPYFDYYIRLYQDLFNSHDNYEKFCNLVERQGSEGKFFQAADEVIQSAIASVKDNSSYQDGFLRADMNRYRVENPLPKGNLYKSHNSRGHYFSLDMRKANFTALRFFMGSIVGDTESYEGFLGDFTDEEYFFISKQIRQVIFGNLNPKRQQTVQKWIMGQIAGPLSDAEYEIVCGTSDEIIFRDPLATPISEVAPLLSKIIEDISGPALYNGSLSIDDFRLEKFWLEPVVEDKEFFVKEVFSEDEDDSITFKNVPAHYFAEVYKTYLGEPITIMDRLSYYDGRIVEFKTPLF